MPKAIHQARSINIRISADKTRTFETKKFSGTPYTVVPLVGLVEGVLHSSNSPSPELALSAEFGKIPESWNGRPLVMNHPSIDGESVSANSPGVLETFQIGHVFNTALDGKKLQMEAWVDTASLVDEVSDVVDRLNSGEEIEVSTGLFADVEETKGIFNGEEYSGIWRNIVPDHLAVLSAGVLGACSVDDGCGVPKTNAAPSDGDNSAWPAFRSSCGCEACTMTKTTTVPTVPLAKAAGHTVTVPVTAEDGTGGTTGEDVEAIRTAAYNQILGDTGETAFAALQATLRDSQIADGIMDMDVKQLTRDALRSAGEEGSWIWGFTQSKVVYDTYTPGVGFTVFQQSLDIADDGKVTLGDDKEEVNLMTKVVPKVNSDAKETSMPDTTPKPTGTPVTSEATPTVETPAVEDTTETPAVETAPVQNAAVETPVAPKTAAQYLAEMPSELREQMEVGQKLLQEKRSSIIANITATGRSKFSEEALKAMSLEMLENLAELASVPSYEGGQGTRAPITDNADANAVPEAPLAFPRNAAVENDNQAAAA